MIDEIAGQQPVVVMKFL